MGFNEKPHYTCTKIYGTYFTSTKYSSSQLKCKTSKCNSDKELL